jgi:hypothetical protein
MAVDLVWEEPPAGQYGRGKAGEVDRTVEVLKKNPGKWARVEDEATSSSAVVKWKKRGCDAIARGLPKEKGKGYRYAIYVRWPEPKAPDPKELAKKATPEQLAKAYAEKHGAAVAGVPRQQHLTEEQQVDQAWRDRLGGKKAPR